MLVKAFLKREISSSIIAWFDGTAAAAADAAGGVVDAHFAQNGNIQNCGRSAALRTAQFFSIFICEDTVGDMNRT